LSLPGKPDETAEPLLNIFCRIVYQLMLLPFHSKHMLGMKFDKKTLDKAILSISVSSQGDKELFFQSLMREATFLTCIPFSVVTHAIISRFKSGKSNNKVVHETTLELVQYVSIALINVSPNHKSYIGDQHTCVLYCEKCNQRFGLIGNIF